MLLHSCSRFSSSQQRLHFSAKAIRREGIRQVILSSHLETIQGNPCNRDPGLCQVSFKVSQDNNSISSTGSTLGCSVRDGDQSHRNGFPADDLHLLQPKRPNTRKQPTSVWLPRFLIFMYKDVYLFIVPLAIKNEQRERQTRQPGRIVSQQNVFHFFHEASTAL